MCQTLCVFYIYLYIYIQSLQYMHDMDKLNLRPSCTLFHQGTYFLNNSFVFSPVIKTIY